MRFLVAFSRLVVGLLFIVSGLIKLNDPVGFSFKLEEYFAPGVLDLPWLMPYALTLSLILVVVEVLLGVMLLLGFKPRFTLWSLLLMIVFFTFLTFYSAYFNKVTDCGCFGDAIKLTPWESFTKDVILLLLILLLMAGRQYIRPILDSQREKFALAAALIACVGYAYYVLNHLPVIDFRPYKTGANISEGMKIPDGAPKPIFEYAWKFRVDGREETYITKGDYPTVDGEFLSVETTEVQAGYEPPIHDFSIEKNGQDHTEAMLSQDKLMVVVAYDLAKSEMSAMASLKEVADRAKSNGYQVIGLSASTSDVAASVVEEYELGFDFYFTDQTTLKTIVRSNPGVLLLQQGTIMQKLHYNDLEKLDFK